MFCKSEFIKAKHTLELVSIIHLVSQSLLLWIVRASIRRRPQRCDARRLRVGVIRPRLARPSHGVESDPLHVVYCRCESVPNLVVIAAVYEPRRADARRHHALPFQPRHHEQVPARARLLVEAAQPRPISCRSLGDREHADEALCSN